MREEDRQAQLNARSRQERVAIVANAGSANILPMNFLTVSSICISGFAAISALLLFFTYAAFIRVPGKSAFAVFSCAALVLCLSTLEMGHLRYFLGGHEPLT